MNVGEKLFQLRKSKNLSQEDVAEKLNVTRQTISKWETNQSTPDFDKIVPLCELFEISTDELLKGTKSENGEVKKQNEHLNNEEIEKEQYSPAEIRRKSAEVVSTSVLLYILSVVILTVGIAYFDFDPILVTAIFLCMIGVATTRIIKHYMSIPKIEETKEQVKEGKVIKQINSIIGIICITIYFFVSFMTMAWHITWIIFIINGLLCEIVKLIFMLKEENPDEN